MEKSASPIRPRLIATRAGSSPISPPDLGVEGRLLLRAHAAERRQPGQVTGQGIVLRRLVARGIALDRAPTVVGRNRRLGGQQGHRVQQIVGRKRLGERGQPPLRRHQHRPVQVDAVLLGQDSRQRRDAQPAITFAGDRLGRAPALVHGQPLPDEAGDGVQVAIYPVIGLRVARLAVRSGQHAAVAGAHRVDEDQVGEADPAVRVVFQARRRRGEAAIASRDDGLRPDRGDVEVNAGGPRAAIEDEGHRPLGGVHAFERVGNVEELGIGALGVLADFEHAGGGDVVRQLLRHRTRRGCEQEGEPEGKREQPSACDRNAHFPHPSFQSWAVPQYGLTAQPRTRRKPRPASDGTLCGKLRIEHHGPARQHRHTGRRGGSIICMGSLSTLSELSQQPT